MTSALSTGADQQYTRKIHKRDYPGDCPTVGSAGLGSGAGVVASWMTQVPGGRDERNGR